MTDPLPPEDSDQAALHRPGTDGVQARDLVERVINTYNARLAAARRSPVPEAADAVDSWREARDQAADALERLDAASEDETVEIALRYAALLKELKGR
ncbi:hypothetical protein ACFQ71_06990 [Streptomyces sp. NPDC056534]|uniref:hypothetical protein n=1 Tax=Streptomyces sp. NPDC056534 TaxID=3345857 RepID=UPI0036CAAEE0